MIIVDSDVLIDALRGREPSRERVARAIESRTLATTSITLFELLSGACSPSEQRKVETLLSALSILAVDEAAAITASEIRRTLQARGFGIGMADYLIAGVCLSKAYPLMTRNREHFGRVEGLELL